MQRLQGLAPSRRACGSVIGRDGPPVDHRGRRIRRLEPGRSLAGRHPDWEIVALDNLYRRGSELNLPRLEQAGVEFIEGDVRSPEDLQALPRSRR